MIDETIKKIETRVHSANDLDPAKRKELLTLVARLRAEISGLSEKDREQARSIAGFADLSTHEAMRKEQKPQLLQHALDGLNSTVYGFEEAHPNLVEIVNRIAMALSNLGI